jgi:5-carboxymethyl-2-hydroxymuconate isomerase
LASDDRVSMIEFIAHPEIEFRGGTVAFGEARVVAPLKPPTVYGLGLNYHATVRDMGVQVPKAPYLFPKLVSSLVGPTDDIRYDPRVTRRVDWEGELAVVIGKQGRDVPSHRALDMVFGYTVANDVSARDLQEADGQWVRGKGLDTFCPLGPEVVTAAEFGSPDDVRVCTWLDDELVQDGRTSDMIFSTAELISYLSRWFTLQPGDVILTGTPAGCGDFREPRRALGDGQTVRVEVEGIGEIANPVVAREDALLACSLTEAL